MEGSPVLHDDADTADIYPSMPITTGHETVSEVDLTRLAGVISELRKSGHEPNPDTIKELTGLPESLIYRALMDER